MDWKEIIGWKYEKIDEENRRVAWETILRFQDFDRADNKSFRKLFRLSHKLMKWKEDEVSNLKEDLKKQSPPEGSVKDPDSVQERVQSATVENGKLRKLVERMENEKSQQKVKLRQLTEEIAIMQKRSQNIEREDSPDALSDLETHEELLTNISMKNKHIKRLLTDLDELEVKNGKQVKESQLLKNKLHEATLSLESLNAQFKDSQMVIKDQMKLIEEVNAKNQSLDEIISEMQRDVNERDEEITAFGRELEQKVLVWKRMFDSKQNELESLKIKYEDVVDRHPGYNIDVERAELVKLSSSVKERDCLINDLEEKVFEMSNELITATEVINKLILKERELKEKTKRPRSADCCSEARDQLSLAKKQLIDLQESNLSLEEENIAKAKQAMEAIDMLSKYENGEEGLSDALKKISELERKIRVRDKDIKEMVKQINRSQDVARENIALREQLGIDEREVVPTTFIEAKIKKMEKMNERLTLKLRASEEMRLKMKLERNELMKELRRKEEDSEDHSSSPESDQPQHGREDKERLKVVMEEFKKKEAKWKKEQQRMEKSHEIILKENENLRMGMYEILNKLRSEEGTSSTIPLDYGLINRLLSVLDTDKSEGYYASAAIRPQMEIPFKKEEERPPKDQMIEKKPSCHLEDSSTQTAMDSNNQLTASCGFEEILTHVKELVEENSNLTTELSQLKAVNHQLIEKTTPNDDQEDPSPSLLSKCDFLVEENVFLCRRLKSSKERTMQILNQIQRKFIELKMNESALQITTSTDNSPLNQDIRSSLATIKAELCKSFFVDVQEEDLWKRITAEKELSKVEVIDDDLHARNFITSQEYNRLIQDADGLRIKTKELLERNKILEEALRVVKSQLEENQLMATRDSDEQISLRHLVVDLQSTGSENQIIARGHRDLMMAVRGKDELQLENGELRRRIEDMQREMGELEDRRMQEKEGNHQEIKNLTVKLSYLRTTLQQMCEMYGKYTPLLEIEAFVGLYKGLQEEKRKNGIDKSGTRIIEENVKRMMEEVKGASGGHTDQERIDLIRWTTQCELLEVELKMMNEKMRQLEDDLHEKRVDTMRNNQHWMALEMLFRDQPKDVKSSPKSCNEIGIQVALEVSPDKSPIKSRTSPERTKTPQEPIPAPRKELKRELTFDAEPSSSNNKCLESQLKQAMSLASNRSVLLLETENRLAEAQGRVKAMEKCLEERQRQIKEQQNVKEGLDLDKRDDNIFSITIASLQNLLLEKDTTLSRYQELLKTERMEHSKSCSEFQLELETIKMRNDDLNRKIKERDQLLEDLNKRFSDLEGVQGGVLSSGRDPDMEKGSREVDADEMSFNLMDSNRIDDIYVTESKEFELAELQMEIQELTEKLRVSEEEINRLQQRLLDVSKRESGWENVLAEKDLEIESLVRKLKEVGDEKRSDVSMYTDRNIEELKDMLDEKDRHIHDLTRTLHHFHDDQQNYMKDTTLSSAEDIARMASELSRSEASNKVLNTQIEALKRQMGNLEQREKQAREMVKTLKQQLMKRPVISVGKTLHKEDQYQRKIEGLQSELTLTKEELRKQTHLAEQRKAKGQQELQLWEKQKRAQQSAEKLKMRLADREQELDKIKCQLAAARQAVSRMEREKQMMEGKRNSHCCQSPSCPAQRGGKGALKGRPAAETPETGDDDEEDEDEGGYYGEIVGITTVPKQELNTEVIKALKARIEIQQRKIVAMELEGKGTTHMAQEVEKFQERLANLESQNLRLEAKNLQFQLENDLLRKGDENERQQRQIKHLEDYVLVLKEELSQAVAVASTVTDQPVRLTKSQNANETKAQNMEQTILALKRIVERLRMENKALRDGKMTGISTPGTLQKTQLELKRVQDLYAEALNKITSNEMGKNCRPDGTPSDGAELKVTMLKLEQKTQLLEKAKVLLTRAAAKEKNLREQIEMWKRKCSELPVIDEISE